MVKAGLVALAVAFPVGFPMLGTLAGGCEICDRPGSSGTPWICMPTMDPGYENCAAEEHSCANWEPLCDGDRGDNEFCRFINITDEQWQITCGNL